MPHSVEICLVFVISVFIRDFLTHLQAANLLDSLPPFPPYLPLSLHSSLLPPALPPFFSPSVPRGLVAGVIFSFIFRTQHIS